MRRFALAALLPALLVLCLASCQEGVDAVPTGPDTAANARVLEQPYYDECYEFLYDLFDSNIYEEMEFSVNLQKGGTFTNHLEAWGEENWFEVRVPPGTVNLADMASRTWTFTISAAPLGGPLCMEATLLKFESPPVNFNNPVELVLCPGPWYDFSPSGYSLYEIEYDQITETYSTVNLSGCARIYGELGNLRQGVLEIQPGGARGLGGGGLLNWVFDPDKPGGETSDVPMQEF